LADVQWVQDFFPEMITNVGGISSYRSWIESTIAPTTLINKDINIANNIIQSALD